MVYLLKRSGKTSTPHVLTYEERLLGTTARPGAIARGALIDKDIAFIENSGDQRLKAALERKYEKEKANSDHIKRMYGNAFDNKDNQGNLYKDSSIASPIVDPSSSKKDVKKMQNILKENL